MTKQELEKRFLELETKYAELERKVALLATPPSSIKADYKPNNGLKFG